MYVSMSADAIRRDLPLGLTGTVLNFPQSIKR